MSTILFPSVDPQALCTRQKTWVSYGKEEMCQCKHDSELDFSASFVLMMMLVIVLMGDQVRFCEGIVL